MGEIGGNMMLESVLTDITKKLLHILNLNHPGSAKRHQRIVCEAPFSHITANRTAEFIRGKPRKTHWTSLHPPIQGAKCVLFPNCSRNNLLEVHLYALAKKMLRKIR